MPDNIQNLNASLASGLKKAQSNDKEPGVSENIEKDFNPGLNFNPEIKNPTVEVENNNLTVNQEVSVKPPSLEIKQTEPPSLIVNNQKKPSLALPKSLTSKPSLAIKKKDEYEEKSKMAEVKAPVGEEQVFKRIFELALSAMGAAIRPHGVAALVVGGVFSKVGEKLSIDKLKTLGDGLVSYGQDKLKHIDEMEEYLNRKVKVPKKNLDQNPIKTEQAEKQSNTGLVERTYNAKLDYTRLQTNEVGKTDMTPGYDKAKQEASSLQKLAPKPTPEPEIKNENTIKPSRPKPMGK